MSDSYSYHCDYVDSETNEHLNSDYYHRWNDDDLPPDAIPRIGDVITIKGERYCVLSITSDWESEMTDLDDHGSEWDEHCYLTIFLRKLLSAPPYSIIIQDNSSCAIVEYTGAEMVVNIPKEIDGKTVVSIYFRALSDRDDITEIIIPDSISEIKNETFINCRRLERIVLPDSITEIGKKAFLGCRGLTSIVIPKSVTKIGERAFYDTGLASIIVEESNSTYDSRDRCNAIIKTKDNELILGCKNTVIPDSITRIGESAFSHCSALDSMIIPDSVTEIGSFAFWRCTALSSVFIPNSVTEIGNSAFAGCTALTSITIPDSVNKIGDKAFEHCTALHSITISFNSLKVQPSAFDRNTLNGMVVPDSMTNVYTRRKVQAWAYWLRMYREYGWCQNLERIEIGKKAYHEFKPWLREIVPKKVKIRIIDGTLRDRFSLWLWRHFIPSRGHSCTGQHSYR